MIKNKNKNSKVKEESKLKTKSNKITNVGKAVGIGAGVVALAAAGYFFLGAEGKKNRTKTTEWAMKMKKDVVKNLESMEGVTKEKYDALVDNVSAVYMAMSEQEEVQDLTRELKSHWKVISSSATEKAKSLLSDASKKIKNTPKKTIKKNIKKTTNKIQKNKK